MARTRTVEQGAAVAPPSGWLNTTFRSLSIPAFRYLWLGTGLSFIAFQMSHTAQGVVAFEITGNNRAVGLVAFGQGLAMLVLAPFGGAVADRVSKRLLLLVCQTVIGLTMLSVALLLWTDAITVLYLAVSSFVMGLMFSFLAPARQAFIGDLVDLERRGNAVALTQVAQNLSRVLGPFLAAGLLAWGLVGATGTYLFMTGVFVAVVATLARTPPSAPRASGGPNMLGDLVLGVGHVRENPRLLALVGGFIVMVMVAFPYVTVLPGFATNVLGVGTAGVGILLGVSAVGGLAVSLAVASLADHPAARPALVSCSFGLGVALLLTSLAPTFWTALLAMALLGGVSSGFQTLNNALALRETAPAFYGRVMGLMIVAWSGNSLVSLPVGMLADRVGERGALATMGVAALVIAVALELATRRLIRLPSR